MADNSRFRQRLFKSLRLGVILNCLCIIAFFSAAFFYRSRIDSLESSVVALSLRNADLSSRLSLALHALTNDYFKAAASFAGSFSSRVDRVSLPLSVVSNSSVIASSPVSDIPDIAFSGYFEFNGSAYIQVRNKYYSIGDYVLGYPIQDITPDIVKYRDKYFKVKEQQ